MPVAGGPLPLSPLEAAEVPEPPCEPEPLWLSRLPEGPALP
jgi:hypothetical protein